MVTNLRAEIEALEHELSAVLDWSIVPAHLRKPIQQRLAALKLKADALPPTAPRRLP